jgi:hypothetical protein
LLFLSLVSLEEQIGVNLNTSGSGEGCAIYPHISSPEWKRATRLLTTHDSTSILPSEDRTVDEDQTFDWAESINEISLGFKDWAG